MDLSIWAGLHETACLFLFQTVQHGSCAGLPRAAQHWRDHGLWTGREHPLGELAPHKHGAGREEHGRSPQRPRALHILSEPSVHFRCDLNLTITSALTLTLPFHEAYVDEKNKVVSTPSFMWDTDYHYHYIFDGIGNMVKHVMRMSTKWGGPLTTEIMNVDADSAFTSVL